MKRRDFVIHLAVALPGGAVAAGALRGTKQPKPLKNYDPKKHTYAMGVRVDKCIGCQRCVEACKQENNVPRQPAYFRTWIERYAIKKDDSVEVENIDPVIKKYSRPISEKGVLRSFFVPKLCNQCKHPPCVQVCPVKATFQTEDGVVLVDKNSCLGCRYCVQACPYGARYIHPETLTADKCTFCYHRLRRGLLPACVEVCPSQARIFGDLKLRSSPLVRLKRMNTIYILKPFLNTEPKVFYTQLDGVVQ